MPVKLPLAANYNNLNDSDVLFCDLIYTATLAASTATPLTVPIVSDVGGTNTSSVNNFMVARIRHTPNNDVWLSNGGTAGAPGGSSFAKKTSVLLDNNFSEYKVKSGDTLSFYTAASNVNVSVEFYWL